MKYIRELESKIKDLLRKKDRVVVAIDGLCASGKTTLAEELRLRFDASVIHADHFFLRDEQKNEARLAEPGGNLDRERFLEEVVAHLEKEEDFFYRPYDCHTATFLPPILVKGKRLIVVEGSYCLHPAFGKYYDLSVFVFVPSLIQVKRILQRPEHLREKFIHQWIPMEERYHEAFSISQNCDMVLDGTEILEESMDE